MGKGEDREKKQSLKKSQEKKSTSKEEVQRKASLLSKKSSTDSINSLGSRETSSSHVPLSKQLSADSYSEDEGNNPLMLSGGPSKRTGLFGLIRKSSQPNSLRSGRSLSNNNNNNNITNPQPSQGNDEEKLDSEVNSLSSSMSSVNLQVPTSLALYEIPPNFTEQAMRFFNLLKNIKSDKRAIEAAKLLLKMYENDPTGYKKTEEEIKMLESKKIELEKQKDSLLEEFPETIRAKLQENANKQDGPSGVFEMSTKALETTEGYAQILMISKQITQEKRAVEAAKLLLTMYAKDPSGYKQTEDQIFKLNENLKYLTQKRTKLLEKMPNRIKELFPEDNSQNWEQGSQNSDQSDSNPSKIINKVNQLFNRNSGRRDTVENVQSGSWGRRDRKKTSFRSTTISIDHLHSYMKQLRGSSNNEDDLITQIAISEPELGQKTRDIQFDQQGFVISRKGLLELKSSSFSSKKNWEKMLVEISDGHLTLHLNTGPKTLVLTDTEVRPIQHEKQEQNGFILMRLKNFKDIIFGNFPDAQDRELWFHIFQLHSDLASTRSFGAALISQCARTKTGIPVFIDNALKYLYRPEVLKTEGIFRISSAQKYIMDWKAKINTGDYDLFTEKDPLVIANLLKHYLRELPNPLLTYQFYDLWNNLYEQDFPEDQLIQLLKGLPDPHQYVLHQVLNLLVHASQYSEQSKMTADNFAIVFGQTLLRNKSGDNISLATCLVKHLIDHSAIVNKVLVPQADQGLKESMEILLTPKRERKKKNTNTEEVQNILHLQVASEEQ